jgi:hypothetical protein
MYNTLVDEKYSQILADDAVGNAKLNFNSLQNRNDYSIISCTSLLMSFFLMCFCDLVSSPWERCGLSWVLFKYLSGKSEKTT